jgi:Raf kinase inhibitor-like YbhB/YbcL family protein
VHWVLYRIPVGAGGLPEGVPPAEHINDPGGAIQGRNSWTRIGYGGPEPPRGHGIHHYRFRLYALDAALSLGPGADIEALTKAISGHVLGESELVGTYER